VSVSFDLDHATTDFAQQIQDLLDSVLPPFREADPEERRLKVIRKREWRVIRPGSAEKSQSIRLLHDGAHVADLNLYYWCAPDHADSHLAVRKSSFEVRSLQEGTPLLRLDYLHDARSVPAAHWNVHAERGAASVLLARCNPKHKGLLSQVHIPVGGTRYRPCLEDFLEMLLREFNFDACPGWEAAVRSGRRRWRLLQTRAVVRDSPDTAAAVLGSLGYTVVPPPEGPRAPNEAALYER